MDSASARYTTSPRQLVRSQAEDNEIETHGIDKRGSEDGRVTLDDSTANTLDPDHLKQYT